MKASKLTPYLYVLPAFLIVATFMYAPVFMNLYYSGFQMSAFSSQPKFIGFENYLSVFRDDVFYIALKNNALFALVSVIMQCGFGLIIAIFLESKLLGKSRTLYRTVYFVPSIISVSAAGMLWSFIYEPSVGLLNTWLKVIGQENLAIAWLGNSKTAMMAIIFMSQWQYVGYITILMVVAIQKIPAELFEAASIDGATAVLKAWHITLPQVKEMLLVSVVITTIGAFKVFTEVYVTTLGGPGQATQVLGTFLYSQGFINNKLGYASAIGIVAFLITFVLSIVQIKVTRSGNE